jgi:phosphatidyl-myo-inositol dimannoside synthase
LEAQIVIVTFGLLPGRERLMPWRTVLEVACRMQERGQVVWLANIDEGAEQAHVCHDFGVPMYCCRDVGDLDTNLVFDGRIEFAPDLVYWPITWRCGLKSDSCWHPWKHVTIVYHGGGCYSSSHVLAGLRHLSLSRLKALAAETFAPKSLLARTLRKKNVSGAICMTDVTRNALTRAGWPAECCVAVPPGIPLTTEALESPRNLQKVPRSCLKERYVLFLGNPLPIRGTNTLVSAARKVSLQNMDARIVCLMRPDPGREMREARDNILHRVKELGIDEQFICVTERLSPSEVREWITNARAVVMPFLFVPSEIPLGILEAMQAGTPVITTRCGGTSEFVDKGGWIVPPGNATSLAEAITTALNDDKARAEKAVVCRERMAHHPTWSDVGDAWLDFGMSFLSGERE